MNKMNTKLWWKKKSSSVSRPWTMDKLDTTSASALLNEAHEYE